MHQKVVGTKVSIEVKRSSRRGRPNHPIELKRRLAQQACEPGVSVAQLALDHGINANLLFKWRRHYQAGLFDAPAKQQAMLPVAIMSDDVASSLPTTQGEASRSLVSATLSNEARSAIEVKFIDATVRIDSGADITLLRAVLAALRR